MKNKLQTLLVALMAIGAIHHPAAQVTAFTYQGRLNYSGQCSNGYYDFQFTLNSTALGFKCSERVGWIEERSGFGVWEDNSLPRALWFR